MGVWWQSWVFYSSAFQMPCFSFQIFFWLLLFTAVPSFSESEASDPKRMSTPLNYIVDCNLLLSVSCDHAFTYSECFIGISWNQLTASFCPLPCYEFTPFKTVLFNVLMKFLDRYMKSSLLSWFRIPGFIVKPGREECSAWPINVFLVRHLGERDIFCWETFFIVVAIMW